MSEWIRVAELPLDVNLSDLTRYLSAQGIAHRISEEQAHQVIWCADSQAAARVMNIMEHWSNGDITLPQLGAISGHSSSAKPGLADYLKLTPITLLMISLSLLGALLVFTDPALTWVRWLTFQDIFFSNRLIGFIDVEDGLQNGELWRLWTPMFLHFSGFHILFNSLWLWELGRRVERLNGPLNYFFLIMVMSLSANIGQYLLEGPSVFGGMSGVIYGLVGYIWMRQKFNPHPLLAVPKGMIIFMLVWLLACVFGLADIFMDNSVANGAHIGGLVAGMLIGAWPKQLAFRR